MTQDNAVVKLSTVEAVKQLGKLRKEYIRTVNELKKAGLGQRQAEKQAARDIEKRLAGRQGRGGLRGGIGYHKIAKGFFGSGDDPEELKSHLKSSVGMATTPMGQEEIEEANKKTQDQLVKDQQKAQAVIANTRHKFAMKMVKREKWQANETSRIQIAAQREEDARIKAEQKEITDRANTTAKTRDKLARRLSKDKEGRDRLSLKITNERTRAENIIL